MTDEIRIRGDRVQYIREEILHESALADLAPHLVTRLATTLPVLPQHATRFLHFDPDTGNGLVMLETAPKRHAMRVRHSGYEDSPYELDAERRDVDGVGVFNVQLPYQYFTFSFHADLRQTALTNFNISLSYLYWAPRPIRTPEDTVWPARCPNVDELGSICWGSTNSDSTSLSAKLDDLVNNFFTTTFNEDLGHYTPFDTSLLDWEADSEDPLAYLNWDMWHGVGLTPAEVYLRLMNHEPTNLASLNPAYVNLPELPQDFSVLRAREWLDNLDPGARRRLDAALTLEVPA